VFNLNLGYNWGKYKLRLGIENLLDKDPPVYGTLGRRYYVGVKASF